MNYYAENEGDKLWDEFQKKIRIPKIIYRTLMVILAVIILLTAGYLIYLLNSSMRPVVKVEQINSSPEKYLPYDANIKIIPKEQREEIFTYAFLADSRGELLNSGNYHQAHPNDKVIKHRMSKASYDLVIFSNDQPDPKFLKIKEV
jgi:hypothetical protein